MREMGIEFPHLAIHQGRLHLHLLWCGRHGGSWGYNQQKQGAISITLWSFTVTILFWKTLVYFFASE
jgi:predicted metalloprotease